MRPCALHTKGSKMLHIYYSEKPQWDVWLLVVITSHSWLSLHPTQQRLYHMLPNNSELGVKPDKDGKKCFTVWFKLLFKILPVPKIPNIMNIGARCQNWPWRYFGNILVIFSHRSRFFQNFENVGIDFGASQVPEMIMKRLTPAPGGGDCSSI